MEMPVLCHCLVGPQGSGKTTLAKVLEQRWPNSIRISTDDIRNTLSPDNPFQVTWAEVEKVVIERAKAAISEGVSVIYDATNVKRSWRMGIIRSLSNDHTHWIAWLLPTPLSQCKQRNRQRTTGKVPNSVIDLYFQYLKETPPEKGEGFLAVNTVPLHLNQTFNVDKIEQLIKKLPRSKVNQRNRQSNSAYHPFSDLLAFEQLIFLIRVILQYPGVGHLHHADPQILKEILEVKELPPQINDVQEISQIIEKLHGPIYADPKAIAHNLQWLEDDQIVNTPYASTPLTLSKVELPPLYGEHRYSDREPFERLIQMIRYISHSPYEYVKGEPVIQTLCQSMASQNVLFGNQEANLRKDIQLVLKPYGIMTTYSSRKGYFIGNSILMKTDLKILNECLEETVNQLDVPHALETLTQFKERLKVLEVQDNFDYPTRTVLKRSFIDTEKLSENSQSLVLPKNMEVLEQAIRQRNKLQLERIQGRGEFEGREVDYRPVLPLQIIFYGGGWYLGFQDAKGLLLYERLDRLALAQIDVSVSKLVQKQAVDQLNRLLDDSYGLYLGDSPQQQQQYLSNDPKAVAAITEEIELRFKDDIYKFVSEKTRRFRNLKLSPRLDNSPTSLEEKKHLFTLKRDSKDLFPNRMQITFPSWVIDKDIDFLGWLLGLGGKVKVHTPVKLKKKVYEKGQEIAAVYAEKTESDSSISEEN